MSGQRNGESGPYRVGMSSETRTEVLHLHQEALEKGKGQPFLRAFRQIIERFRNDPRDFGEPLYRLPALHLQVRQAVILPLVVVFGVHEEEPLVFIRGFKVLS